MKVDQRTKRERELDELALVQDVEELIKQLEVADECAKAWELQRVALANKLNQLGYKGK